MEHPDVFEFGPFRLDVVRRQLWRGGARLSINAKGFDTLAVLVRACGRTLTRDELIELVWSGAAVEENNLSQAISRVRKALDDDPERPEYIVTVPGQGYRFVADVTAPHAAPHASGPQAFDAAAARVAFEPAPARTRLIVLPFRVLKPDPDTDFLSFSLPDALTTTLANVESLTVRSSLVAARYCGPALDLEAIARETEVDCVLTGTLLRAGAEIRVNTQLVEAPNGAVLWSQMLQAPLADVGGLQDQLTRRIVESLELTLTPRERRLLDQDFAASPRAYELYLRANQLSFDRAHWGVARDLYAECLQHDPHFAPAWARLGRIHRLLAISGGGADDYRRAQHAFRRALEITPDLPLAHNLYTYLEVEVGGASDAMVRLLEHAQGRPPSADVFAGLVHACRYCGLLDAAVAAYREAVRLDPQIRTSVAHAFWMRGDFEEAIRTDMESPTMAAFYSLVELGRIREAIAWLSSTLAQPQVRPLGSYLRCWQAALEERGADVAAASRRLVADTPPQDPCGRFYVARLLARTGRTDAALPLLESAVEGGFFCPAILQRDRALDALRGVPRFAALSAEAAERHRAAAARFDEAGGVRVLGVSAGSPEAAARP